MRLLTAVRGWQTSNKNMKRKITLLLLSMMTTIINIYAQDFFTAKIDRVKTRFKIIDSEKQFCSIYGYSEYANNDIEFFPAIDVDAKGKHGVFTIPETINYNGIEYKITEIGNYAFTDCHNLTEIIIPNSITDIGQYAFSNCNQLTKLKMPSKLHSIGEAAFMLCDKLSVVSIPWGITTIPDDLFNYGWGIRYIIIPPTVSQIGSKSFVCKNLIELSCYAKDPPTLSDDSFKDIPKDAVLSVPKDSYDEYKKSLWGVFFKTIKGKE